jgi:hypothetical protein
MFNKSMAASTSSPLLLKSYVAFDWYAFSAPSSFVAVYTSLGPNFPTIATRFSGQILQTLNLDFIVFFSRTPTRPYPPI